MHPLNLILYTELDKAYLKSNIYTQDQMFYQKNPLGLGAIFTIEYFYQLFVNR